MTYLGEGDGGGGGGGAGGCRRRSERPACASRGFMQVSWWWSRE